MAQDNWTAQGAVGSPATQPSADEIRNAIERILAQPEFQNSNRLREFLRFVTETTLDGRAETLKAVTIAIAVFGRDETFDAHANPIVRVEATRLRKALRAYYEKRGANELVQVEIPVGSYAPVFTYRNPPIDVSAVVAPMAASPSSPEAAPIFVAPPSRHSKAPFWWALPAGLGAAAATLVSALAISLVLPKQGPSTAAVPGEPVRASVVVTDVAELRPVLTVKPFDTAGRQPLALATAGALNRELYQALSRFDDLIVRNSFTSSGAYRAPLPSDYELDGKFESSPPSIILRVRRTDGTDVWSQRFPIRSTDLDAAERAELLRTMVASIAHPLGAVDSDLQGRLRAGKPLPGGVECSMRVFDYELRGDDAARHNAFTCLTEAVAGKGDPVLPNVLLSNLLTASYVANRAPLGTIPPLDAAEEAALRAIAAGPERALGYSALATVYQLRGRPKEAMELARRALDLNPLDASAMATLGMLSILNGDGKAGADLLRRVIADHPNYPSSIRFFLFLDAFERGDQEDQTRALGTGDQTLAPLSILAQAIAQGAAGNKAAARDLMERLKVVAPSLAADPAGAFERLRLDPALARKLAGSVQLAGR